MNLKLNTSYWEIRYSLYLRYRLLGLQIELLNMTKGDYNALLSDGSVNRGLEGRFHVKVTLNDYAGNSNTYDSQLCYNFATQTPSNSYPCNTLPTEQRDLTGKIDNTPPLTMLNPFQNSWSEGGKTAYDTTLTPDSVYINNIYSGYVTRSKTINIKAQVEANQRAMLIVDGVVQKNSSTDANGLIKASDINCKTPDVGTASTEVNVNMPLADKLAPDGLITQYSKLCDIQYVYTFPETQNNTQNQTQDPAQASDIHSFQIITVDNAGQQSKPSQTINIAYDTVAPREPEVILSPDNDSIYVIGERNSYVDFTVTSPTDTTTNIAYQKLSNDGTMVDQEGNIKPVHLDLGGGYGTYTITINNYDSAGNKTTVTRKVERKAAETGGGGGSGANYGNRIIKEPVVVTQQKTTNGIEILDISVPKPQLSNAYTTFDGAYITFSGATVTAGHPVQIITKESAAYQIETKCSGANWIKGCQAVQKLWTKDAQTVEYSALNGDIGLNIRTGTTILSPENIDSELGEFKSKTLKIVDEPTIKLGNTVVATTTGNASFFYQVPYTISNINVASEPKTITKPNLATLGATAPGGMPVNSWTDNNIGRGPNTTGTHDNEFAVDIGNMDTGTDLYATLDGTATLILEAVAMTKNDKGEYIEKCLNTTSLSLGCWVFVRNKESGFGVAYGHNDKEVMNIDLFKNSKVVPVKKGVTKLGKMGNSGYSDVVHVHYEIRTGLVNEDGNDSFWNLKSEVFGKTDDAIRQSMSDLTGIPTSQLSKTSLPAKQ